MADRRAAPQAAMVSGSILRGQESVRAAGLCGELSPDGRHMCIKDAGHDDPHGDRHWPAAAPQADAAQDTDAEIIGTALASLRNAAEAWPLPNVYRDAFLAGDAALERLVAAVAAVAAAEQEPRVTCVARDSHGNPYPTVRLLGDREAVAAVTQAVARADRLEQALRKILTSCEDANQSYERLSIAAAARAALASPAPDREAG